MRLPLILLLALVAIVFTYSVTKTDNATMELLNRDSNETELNDTNGSNITWRRSNDDDDDDDYSDTSEQDSCERDDSCEDWYRSRYPPRKDSSPEDSTKPWSTKKPRFAGPE